MINIKRTVESDENLPEKCYNYSQASLNSDGQIVIRNYNQYGTADKRETEELFVLSVNETRAVFALMKVIGEHMNTLTGLPF